MCVSVYVCVCVYMCVCVCFPSMDTAAGALRSKTSVDKLIFPHLR